MHPMIPVLTIALLLSACEPRSTEDSKDITATAPGEAATVQLDQPPALAVNPAPAQPPLTADGWGALKIGMTEAQAGTAAAGLKPLDGAVEPSECQMRQLLAPSDTWIMLEKGCCHSNHHSRFLTFGHRARTGDRGYGRGGEGGVPCGGVAEMPHKYSPPPAKDLFVWTNPGEKGVRYEIGPDGKVAQIHVGGSSIRYVEGCS